MQVIAIYLLPPAAAVALQAESLVQHLASEMASEGIEAKTLTLKLKTTTFEAGMADMQRHWVLSKCSFAWGLTLPMFVGW